MRAAFAVRCVVFVTCQVILVDPFPADELATIILERVRAEGQGCLLSPQEANQLAALHNSLQGTVTMREVIKIARRKHRFGCSLQDAAVSLLFHKAAADAPAARDKLVEAVRTVPGWSEVVWPGLADASAQQLNSGVRFCLGTVSTVVPGASLSGSPLWSRCGGLQADRPTRAVPQSLVCALVSIALAAANGEPVLLLGPSSYKSLAVTTFCHITGRQGGLITEHLTEGEL